MQRMGIVLVILAVGLTACGEDAATNGDEDADRMLPDAFYGEWEHTGTSGGLDGRGIPDAGETRARMVITRRNTLERRGPDGEGTTERFTVRKGTTIFSSEDQWMIVPESGVMELVVRILPDGSLEMSDNVYDGFSSSYRRVGEPGPR